MARIFRSRNGSILLYKITVTTPEAEEENAAKQISLVDHQIVRSWPCPLLQSAKKHSKQKTLSQNGFPELGLARKAVGESQDLDPRAVEPDFLIRW